MVDYADSLAADNVAYAAIRPNRPINVLLVTPGNSALETALQTARVQQVASLQTQGVSFLTDPKYSESANNSAYDLIVFDQCSPTTMPQSNTLFIGSLPPRDPAKAAKAAPATPSITVTGKGKGKDKEETHTSPGITLTIKK